MARLSGTIIKFDDERGFGFIAPDSETGDLFFHVNAIVGGRLGVPAVYGVMSVISFGAYAMDKRAARTSAWRTAESTLHLWDLAGGWPGGLVAQQLLRHKRQKIGFVTVTALTACFHILAWGWLVLSEDGRAVLSNLG